MLLLLLLLLLLGEIADEATLIKSALAVRFCTRDRRAETVGPLRLKGQDMRRSRVHPLRRDGSRSRRRRSIPSAPSATLPYGGGVVGGGPPTGEGEER